MSWDLENPLLKNRNCVLILSSKNSVEKFPSLFKAIKTKPKQTIKWLSPRYKMRQEALENKEIPATHNSQE